MDCLVVPLLLGAGAVSAGRACKSAIRSSKEVFVVVEDIDCFRDLILTGSACVSCNDFITSSKELCTEDID